MKKYFIIFLFICTELSAAVTIYTVGVSDGNFYGIDAATGAVSLITPTPVALSFIPLGGPPGWSGGGPGSRLASTPIVGTAQGLNGVAVYAPYVGYCAGNDGYLYQVNLQSGMVELLTPNPLIQTMGLNGLTLFHNDAYTTNFNNNHIFKVHLNDGTFIELAPQPPPIHANFAGTQIANSSTAYTVGFSNDIVYETNLSTSQCSALANLPGNQATDIALFGSLIYVVGFDNKIYQLNLENGSISTVAHISGMTTALSGIAILDSQTAYVSSLDGYVYAVNLQTGAFSKVNQVPIATAGINYVSLGFSIPMNGLNGNNKKLASYLNQYGPFATSRLFALQSDPASALMSASPSRNALPTFVAQTTQIALGQIVSKHLQENRSPHHLYEQTKINASRLPEESALLVDASFPHTISQNSLKNSPSYSTWLGILGEYSSEKAQKQVPAFHALSTGFVTAFDCTNEQNIAGAGIAYAYSHIREKEGFGSANVQQGFALIFGESSFAGWYFDGALWGGYYHFTNQRNISFPGFSKTARSSAFGWQLVPHAELGYGEWSFVHSRDVVCSCEPFVSIDVVSSWENDLNEHGTDGLLDFGQTGRWCGLLRTETGFHLREEMIYDWGAVVFFEKGSYVYQKCLQTGTLQAFLIGSPGFFTVTTFTGAQNLGVVEAEVLFAPHKAKYPYGSLSYHGEFGSRYQAQEIQLELGVNF